MLFSLRGFSSRNSRKKARTHSFTPRLEHLEDRSCPSVTLPTAGTPAPVTVTGTAGADQFIIQLQSGSSTNVQFSDDGGASFHTAALADVTQITVNGLGGSDTLTINDANGLVGNTVTGGLPISFVGGPGLSKVVLQGSPVGEVVNEVFTVGSDANAGTLTSTAGTVSQTLTFSKLSAVVDTVQAASLTFNANDNSNMIHIVDGPIVNGQQTTKIVGINRQEENNVSEVRKNSQGDDNNGADEEEYDHNEVDSPQDSTHSSFVPYTLANKTSVTVNTLGGNDYVLLNIPHPADGLTNLTINGGSGFDVVAERNAPATVTVNLNEVELTLTDSEDIFIENLYEHRLLRAASRSEIDGWKNVLHSSGGVSLVVIGIEESTESRDDLVKTWYVHFLGRQALNGEENGWVRLIVGGTSEERVLSVILGSNEFFQRSQSLANTGNQDANFVESLYGLLLNRTGNNLEVDDWRRFGGGAGKSGVVFAFLNSKEFRTDDILAYYSTFLNRNADQGGLKAWSSSGLSLGHIRESFESSAEFTQND